MKEGIKRGRANRNKLEVNVSNENKWTNERRLNKEAANTVGSKLKREKRRSATDNGQTEDHVRLQIAIGLNNCKLIGESAKFSAKHLTEKAPRRETGDGEVLFLWTRAERGGGEGGREVNRERNNDSFLRGGRGEGRLHRMFWTIARRCKIIQ